MPRRRRVRRCDRDSCECVYPRRSNARSTRGSNRPDVARCARAAARTASRQYRADRRPVVGARLARIRSLSGSKRVHWVATTGEHRHDLAVRARGVGAARPDGHVDRRGHRPEARPPAVLGQARRRHAAVVTAFPTNRSRRAPAAGGPGPPAAAEERAPRPAAGRGDRRGGCRHGRRSRRRQPGRSRAGTAGLLTPTRARRARLAASRSSATRNRVTCTRAACSSRDSTRRNCRRWAATARHCRACSDDLREAADAVRRSCRRLSVTGGGVAAAVGVVEAAQLTDAPNTAAAPGASTAAAVQRARRRGAGSVIAALVLVLAAIRRRRTRYRRWRGWCRAWSARAYAVPRRAAARPGGAVRGRRVGRGARRPAARARRGMRRRCLRRGGRGVPARGSGRGGSGRSGSRRWDGGRCARVARCRRGGGCSRSARCGARATWWTPGATACSCGRSPGVAR